jgi:hypothetical protein
MLPGGTVGVNCSSPPPPHWREDDAFSGRPQPPTITGGFLQVAG